MIFYIQVHSCLCYDGMGRIPITRDKKQVHHIPDNLSSEQVFTGFRYTSPGIIQFHKAEARGQRYRTSGNEADAVLH